MAKKKAGAPKNNTNAKKWSEKTATALLENALELSMEPQYAWIGSIWRELAVAKSTIHDICENYPELKVTLEMVKDNCAHNCFELASDKTKHNAGYILNLKSNHGWTDRVENTNNITVKPFNIKDLLSFDEDDE